MTINQNKKSAISPTPISRSVSSMTGYGSAQGSLEGWLILVELRSVNSRFLDLTLKIPDDHRILEAPLKEMIQARLARGKAECRVIVRRSDDVGAVVLNPESITAFNAHYQSLKARVKDLAAPTIRDIMEWPGVRSVNEITPETLRELVFALGQQALEQLLQARSREGAALAELLADRAQKMLTIAAQLRVRLPQVLQDQQRRITERLEAALGLVTDRSASVLSLDETRARIAQEVMIIGLRIDVAEELDRLVVHCQEILHLLTSGHPAGKRLDFIIQELNREANTLGSKMVAEDFSKAAIELKVLIEQMREQVQNLE